MKHRLVLATFLLIIMTLLSMPLPSLGAIVKCVDPDGKVSFAVDSCPDGYRVVESFSEKTTINFSQPKSEDTAINFCQPKDDQLQTQALWGATYSGMPPSEVLKVVDGAHKVENGSTLGTKVKAKELLRIDDFRVVNESFKVLFYFADFKLVQVTLALKKERTFDLSLLVFEGLTETLRSKYGEEISRKIDTSNPFLKKAETNWVSGRTNINLLLFAVGSSTATLNLNYQTRLSKEADKL